ncbi:MAG: class I SAM-dependent methyltransferase [Ginsengibacter sp.]
MIDNVTKNVDMRPDFEKNREIYRKLIRENANKTVIAGRYESDAGKEQFIVEDIIRKLDVKSGLTIFDIGCGAGLVAELLIKNFSGLNAQVSVMDTPELIDVLYSGFIKKDKYLNVETYKGYFPLDFDFNGQKFDRILMYAMLFDIDDPFEMIEAATKLLTPNGKLLLGDLPNISQKGRFLSSVQGRIFDASYKNTIADDLPLYEDHHDFVCKMNEDPGYYSLIDDAFIEKVYRTYTKRGFDVFILPQPGTLPFNKSRHDVLICSYD